VPLMLKTFLPKLAVSCVVNPPMSNEPAPLMVTVPPGSTPSVAFELALIVPLLMVVLPA